MNKSFAELGNLLAPAQSVLITVPQNPNFDQVAAGLALFLSLEKTGKQVSIVSAEEMTVEFSHLVGVDKVGTKLDGQDLVLSLPIERVDKVSSNDEGGRLNLIIKAKLSSPPIKKEQVVFSSSGFSADLILVINAEKLEDLGKIYREEKNLFEEKPVVNLQLNLADTPASSCSEMVASLIQSLGLPVDEDIGGNLFLGLQRATENFQSPLITAGTFEVAAFCLRAGARRQNQPVEKTAPPSPDWLEPKIYKGSTLP